jgi:quercetin dioxygenase-like cupin family protein
VTEPTLVPAGGGEVIGDAPGRRVEILSDHEALNATWSRFGAGREGADLHVHRHHSDLFYVLEGELTVRLGPKDRAVVVPAGRLARVPPLVVHGFRNGSDADMRYLNFHAPGMRFADYLRAMRDKRDFSYDQEPPPADGGRSPTDAVVSGGEVVVDEPGLRVALLTDVEEIAVVEVRSDPGHLWPPVARNGGVESFYVLEGALEATVADRELRVEQGSWLQIPPEAPRGAAVASANGSHFLTVHTPSHELGRRIAR